MDDFIKSLSGLLTALAALIGVVFPIVQWWIKKEKNRQKETNKKVTISVSARISMTIFGAVFLTIMGIRYAPEPQSTRTQITIAAFDALNAQKYDLAIQKADAVINENSGSAALDQERLAHNATPQPPKGTVSDEQKKQIFMNGLLNDVSACYYIKAESLEKLGRINEALSEYEQTTNLTYGRVYDPREGTFWIPSDAALGKLRQLQPAQ